MRRLQPRLYSIASSPRRHPDQVHLLVAVVRYVTNQRQRLGVCSTFLADRVELGRTPVPVFLTTSHFRLPMDDAADVIMVGPGTGLAPFRAFLQEREARGANRSVKLSYKEQRELDGLPERIAALETEQRTISGQLEDGSLYVSDAAKALARSSVASSS